MLASINRIEAQQQQQLLLLQQIQQQFQQNQQQPMHQQHQQHHQQSGVIFGAGQGGFPVVANDTTDDDIMVGTVVGRGIEAVRTARLLGLDATQVLLSSPRVPQLGANMPKSWVNLHTEWDLHDLDSYKYAKTTTWSNATTQRYVKRLRAYRQIQELKITWGDDNELETAYKLDVEREIRKLTLTNHISFLCKNDDKIKKRKRQNDGDGDNI
jgi:hypothetical protein